MELITPLEEIKQFIEDELTKRGFQTLLEHRTCNICAQRETRGRK